MLHSEFSSIVSEVATAERAYSMLDINTEALYRAENDLKQRLAFLKDLLPPPLEDVVKNERH